MTALAITAAIEQELRAALRERDESAWVLRVRPTARGVLLARSLEPVPVHGYLERDSRQMRISSAGFVPQFRAAEAAGESVVFVHTHPGVQPAHSKLDDEVDRRLRAFAEARGLPTYASLNVGGTAEQPRLAGRAWALSDRGRRDITHVRVASPDFRIYLCEGSGDNAAALMFDRQIRAFGPEGQLLLRALRIGIVGAGGTGSPTVEMLARLGVGELVVIDDDLIDETNLTRIHGATVADIGLPKALVAKRTAEAYGTGTRVTAICDRLDTGEAISGLASCDVVFGCTDDHAGRLVLSRLAYRYLVPVIDCGVVISSAGGRIKGIDGRLTVMAPGTRCLICRGQVDPKLAGEQMLDPEERRRRAGEGYATALGEPDPSVVAHTTAVSALAVDAMLGRLFGYAADSASHLLVQFHRREIRAVGKYVLSTHTCMDPAEWGLGDTDLPLGLAGIAS